VRAVIVAAVAAFLVTMLLTPFAIRFFTALKAGQPIREIGPQTHLSKKGTPTMGGVVFILATVIAYVAGHFVLAALPEEQLGAPTGVTATGVVLLGLLIGLGALGFIDDYLKVRKRNSLGLSPRKKLLGQTLVGAGVGAVALWVPSKTIELGLGGLVAGLAFATRTVLLLPLLAVLFTLIAFTWVIQIGSFKLWHRRVFRMVPLQHHFELAGWSEVNIVVRFWIISGLGVASALGLFYADFLRVMEFR